MQTRSVRVNALLPGWVDSPMWKGMSMSTLSWPRESKVLCPLYALYRRAPEILFPSYMVTNVQSRIADLKPELQQKYLAEIPLRRVATPNEVADAALFLAANQYANNCVVNLDGGLSAV